MQQQNRGQVVGIFFSSGDLGDVGRHAVAAALELSPQVVSGIRVFSKDVMSLNQTNWKCNCGNHTLSPEDRGRIEFVPLDCVKDDIAPALIGVDSVVSCLGSRQPFHEERIVRQGTERLVQAALKCRISRFVMISSVGIAVAAKRIFPRAVEYNLRPTKPKKHTQCKRRQGGRPVQMDTTHSR